MKAYVGQLRYRIDPADQRTGLAPDVVLTVDAAQRAGGEEDRPRAAVPGDRRFFAEMRSIPIDGKRGPGSATPSLPGPTVNFAEVRAEPASGKKLLAPQTPPALIDYSNIRIVNESPLRLRTMPGVLGRLRSADMTWSSDGVGEMSTLDRRLTRECRSICGQRHGESLRRHRACG